MSEGLGHTPSDEARLQAQNERASKIADYLDEIGIHRLAEEVRDLRQAAISHNLSYDQLSLAIHEMKEDRLIEGLKSIYASQIAFSTQYENIVAGIGYAGFIALLSLVKSMLYPADFAFVVVFLAISLIVYVCWTAISGVFIVKSINMFYSALNSDEPDRRKLIDLYNQKDLERQVMAAKLQSFWVYAFSACLFTGLIAALWFLSSLIGFIFGIGESLISKSLSLFGFPIGYQV